MKILKRIAFGLILFVFSLYLLVYLFSPMAVRMAANKPLAKLNLQLDKHSQVRLNLFMSRVSINNLKLLSNNETVYVLDSVKIHYSLWRLMTKEIRIHSIFLDGMSIKAALNEQGILIAGVQLPITTDEKTIDAEQETTTKQKNTFAYDISLPVVELNNMQFMFSNFEHPHKFNVRQIQLTDTKMEGEKIATTLAFNADLDGNEIVIASTASVQGTDLDMDIDLNISQLSASSFQYLLPETIEKLALESELELSTSVAANSTQLKVTNTQASLSVSNVNVQESAIGLTLGDFNLAVSVPELAYNLQSQSVQVESAINVSLENAAAATSSNDQIFSLANLAIKDMNLEAVDESYSINIPTISFLELMASKVTNIENQPALFLIQHLNINTIEITNDLISVNEVLLGPGNVSLKLDNAGNLTTLVDTSALASSEEQTSNVEEDTIETETTDQSPMIRLGSLHLTAPMEIDIEDTGHSQPFIKTFEINNIEISEVNSSNPELKTDFFVNIKDQGYFTLEVDGWVQPFTPQINLTSTTTAREFPMNEVAPYLKDTLGFEVKSGLLDADINANIEKNQLDSEAVLLMRGANFAASDIPEDESNLIGQTAIPLNVALNMLKDGDGNIELKVPVKGDINDPNFGLQHVVGLIVKKVVLAQAKNYLMSSFVPYAKVVSVAVVAGESALKVRFQDLEYAPSQVELKTNQLEFANQLALLMNDKANMTVNLCPVALPSEEVSVTSADGSVAKLSAVESAVLRGQTFKDYMVSQFAIESARLLLCSPEVDNDNEALPRIEFSVI